MIENNPKIKAAENFQELMKTLIDTEERIAYCREFYNRSVRKYNVLLISQFPFNVLALIFGFSPMKFVSV